MFIVLLTLSLAAAFFRGHIKLIERAATALITLAALHIAAWVTAQTGTPTTARDAVSSAVGYLAYWADYVAAYLVVAAEAAMVGYLTWQLSGVTHQIWLNLLARNGEKAEDTEDKQSEAIAALGLKLDQTRRDLHSCRMQNHDLAKNLEDAQEENRRLEVELQARRRAARNRSTLTRREVREIIFHLHPDRVRSEVPEGLMSRLTELLREAL